MTSTETVTRTCAPVFRGHVADLDGDAAIGVGDLILLLSAWGPCRAACTADLDGDGVVGFSDLLRLLAAWAT